MSKTGRNDPCPCGSGKKYKNCCMGKETLIGPTGKYTLPFNEIEVDRYPEDLIIKEMSVKSSEFRRFYEAEKDTFPKDVIWLKADPKFASTFSYQIGQGGKFAIATKKDSDTKFIILDSIPPKKEDTVIIAHEMTHAMLYNEGFPGVGAVKSEGISDEVWKINILIATKLSSLIHDILVDSRLKNYGFEFDSLLRKSCQNLIKYYKNELKEPLNPVKNLIILFNYVLTLFQARVIVGKEIGAFVQYQNYFYENFPEISRKGEALYNAIEATGYETPEQVKFIFQRIMELEGLNNGFRFIGGFKD